MLYTSRGTRRMALTVRQREARFVMRAMEEINDFHAYIRDLGQRAQAASHLLSGAATETKNRALQAVAANLLQQRKALLAANREDLRAARQAKLSAALVDRLALNEARVGAMAERLRQIAALPDPVGEISELRHRPSGIQVGRMRVPLGVVGIIYEARPSVTADAAGLCLKAGNAVILRGGSEAFQSNQAIAGCIRDGLRASGLPEDAVLVPNSTDRATVGELLNLPEYVDLIVPRGGKSLIERVSRDSRIPVLKHLDGVCHVYVDQYANLEQAVAIAFNAKTQRYGTCNTMECLLLHADVAADVLRELVPMYAREGVELRGCGACRELFPHLRLASEADYATEYLAPILSLRIVHSLEQAMEHIHRYGSAHTDAIVTEHLERAMRFLREVDSSSVMVNASTRFADGGEYGLGAEIGISTDKLHARGPVGLQGLTTQKYIVFGSGQCRH